MRGLILHANMGDSEFLGEFRTAACYRVHTINDVHPGMYRLQPYEQGGANIWGELYRVPDAVWNAIEAGEPPNLYRGTIELEDSRSVFGILYPRELAEGHFPEITQFGGWRAYMDSLQDK